MKQKDKNKERAYTVFFMFGITFAFMSVLTFVYLLTKDTIIQNESLVLKKAVLAAAGIEFPQKAPVQEIDKYFNENVREIKDHQNRILYYEIVSPQDPSTLKGYVFITDGSGLWGTITAAVGINKKLEKMTGIEFLKQNETPGLGARITEDWFRNQFVNKMFPLKMVPEQQNNTDPQGVDDDQFQAVTGATITSAAIRNIINNTFEKAPHSIKEKHGRQNEAL